MTKIVVFEDGIGIDTYYTSLDTKPNVFVDRYLVVPKDKIYQQAFLDIFSQNNLDPGDYKKVTLDKVVKTMRKEDADIYCFDSLTDPLLNKDWNEIPEKNVVDLMITSGLLDRCVVVSSEGHLRLQMQDFQNRYIAKHALSEQRIVLYDELTRMFNIQ